MILENMCVHVRMHVYMCGVCVCSYTILSRIVVFGVNSQDAVVLFFVLSVWSSYTRKGESSDVYYGNEIYVNVI